MERLSLKVCASDWKEQIPRGVKWAYETYSAKVNDEAVAFVEALPAERDFRGPDHSPTLHMQESLRCQVIGDNMV